MIIRTRDAVRRKNGETTTAVDDPGARIVWDAGVLVDGDTLIPWSTILYVERFDAAASTTSRAGSRNPR